MDRFHVNFLLHKAEAIVSLRMKEKQPNLFDKFHYMSLYQIIKYFSVANKYTEHDLQYTYALILGYLPDSAFIPVNGRAPVLDWDNDSSDEDKLFLIRSASTFFSLELFKK